MITQTDVYKRLKGEVDKTPAIDTHVHLGEYESPLADDLNKVLQYHNYLSEMIASRPGSAINEELPPRERMRAVVPLLKKSNRSTHAWMLREVLRGVYGFEDELTLDNCDALFDKSVEMRQRPNRLREICDIAGVSRILLHLPPKPVAECGYDAAVFLGLSDLGPPSLPNQDALAAFEEKTGATVKSARDLLDATAAYHKRAAEAGHVGLRMDISPGCVYGEASDAERESAFDKAATGKGLSQEERQVLESLAMDAQAIGAAESGMAVQIFFARGAVGSVPLPFADQHLIDSLCAYVTRYPEVAFDVYTVAQTLTQHLCVMAKYRRNLHLGGCWWLCQFPEIMSGTYSLRLDMIAASKWSAFFSDAYVAEWIVGKMALTRKELTRALALKVLDGYMTEEDAVATARDVLFETPCRVYGLQL